MSGWPADNPVLPFSALWPTSQPLNAGDGVWEGAHPGDVPWLPGSCLPSLVPLEPLGHPLVPLATEEVGGGGEVCLDDLLGLAGFSFLLLYAARPLPLLLGLETPLTFCLPLLLEGAEGFETSLTLFSLLFLTVCMYYLAPSISTSYSLSDSIWRNKSFDSSAPGRSMEVASFVLGKMTLWSCLMVTLPTRVLHLFMNCSLVLSKILL